MRGAAFVFTPCIQAVIPLPLAFTAFNLMLYVLRNRSRLKSSNFLEASRPISVQFIMQYLCKAVCHIQHRIGRCSESVSCFEC